MSHRRSRGFTLVELLVVIGIIALLISILLPSLNKARQQANEVKCASNMRQLATALTNYASEHRGWFPPNVDAGGWKSAAPIQPDVAQLWYDVDRIGKYLPKTTVTASNAIATPVMVCPNVPSERGVRTYAMNAWASSSANQNVMNRGADAKASQHSNYTPQPIASTGNKFRGQFLGPKTKESALTILMGERHVTVDGGTLGTFAVATMGFQGNLPGERFLGIVDNTPFAAGPYNAGGLAAGADTEVDYTRHRTAKDRTAGMKARGRANFAFCDGHVEMLSHDELADITTKKSKFRALWSPYDRVIDGQ